MFIRGVPPHPLVSPLPHCHIVPGRPRTPLFLSLQRCACVVAAPNSIVEFISLCNLFAVMYVLTPWICRGQEFGESLLVNSYYPAAECWPCRCETAWMSSGEGTKQPRAEWISGIPTDTVVCSHTAATPATLSVVVCSMVCWTLRISGKDPGNDRLNGLIGSPRT